MSSPVFEPRPLPVERFARQLVLPAIGPKGQERLAQAQVLVVGCGGLGAPLIQYLAAAGVGRLVLVDDDSVEASNLNRQVLFGPTDVGTRKAEAAADAARALSPEAQIEALVQRVAPAEVLLRVRGVDLVVDCADGLPTKYLLNDACVREDKPLIHGAATALSGQVLVVPGARGPCLRCLFPTLPEEGSVPSCREQGILGGVTGAVGSLMAVAAVRALVQPERRDAQAGRFLALDAWELSSRTLRFERDPGCPACGDRPEVDAKNADDYVLPPCEAPVTASPTTNRPRG